MHRKRIQFWLLTVLPSVVVVVLFIGLHFLWIGYQEKQRNKYLSSPILITDQTEVKIPAGTSLSGVARLLVQGGVISNTPEYFINIMMHLGHEKSVKAGNYRFYHDMNHQEIIDKLVNGDVHLEKFRLIAGTTFSTVLENLALSPHISQTIANHDATQIWQMLAPTSNLSPEGMLLPDTYLYEDGTSDIEILRQASDFLNKTLTEEWEARADNLPLESPYEALILASIVEKETGIKDERKLVASVFINRLRKGMRLQSDPTVIYGIGDEFEGDLRRIDLKTATSHNTYTIIGLPPTPIAMVSRESLHATLNPIPSDYYYFVADGNGGHVFSKTLREHNNAVNLYQRRK